jgi:hypothetical protein
MILRKPIFCPAAYTKTVEIIAMSKNGTHHAALRLRSVKVLEGAMNVLMMRAPSDRGATCGAGADVTGGVGTAAMSASWQRSKEF